jgi:hypothetical protein
MTSSSFGQLRCTSRELTLRTRLHKHYSEPARCEVVVWEVVAEERAA